MDSTATDFLTQVLAVAATFKSMTIVGMVSAAIMLVVASMKVTILNKLFWSKLGSFQIWVAPVLGVIAGLLSTLFTGQPITVALVFTYFTAGMGATYIHEILDLVKLIPGLGDVYVGAINIIEGFLGGPASQPAPSPVVPKAVADAPKP